MTTTLQFQGSFPKISSNNNRPTVSNGGHIHNMSDPPTIRDVFEDNFEEEFGMIMNLADKYKVIGMV